MCTSTSQSSIGSPLYLFNKEYPTVKIKPADTNCNCSVETRSCTSKVSAYFIHFELAHGGYSCTDTQKIILSDDRIEHTFSCSQNTNYNITLQLTSSKNYMVVLLENTAETQDGTFWIGFEGKHAMKIFISIYLF